MLHTTRIGRYVMTIDVRSEPHGDKPGRIQGTLGPYRWTFLYDYATHPDKAFGDDILWEYSFSVANAKDYTIYTASRSADSIERSLLKQSYFTDLCAYLAQRFVEEGPR